MRIVTTALLLLLSTQQAAYAAPSSKAQPEVRSLSCNIKTVGYRFVGRAGQSFRYAGNDFTVPSAGSIELVSNRKKTSYEAAGNVLSLDGSPADQFGIRTVTLPNSL